MPSAPIAYSDFKTRLLRLYGLRARATRYKIAEALDAFGAATGATSTADLTTMQVVTWLESRQAAGANPNTTQSYLRSLRTAVNVAIEEGWVERGPSFRRLFRRPARFACQTHYSLDQISALLFHLDSRGDGWRDRRLHALASTVAYTGLRRGEALSLQRSDLDLDRRLLRVVARSPLKTPGAEAVVPIAAELAATLAGWLPRTGPVWVFGGVEQRGPWTGGGPGQRALDKLKAAGAEIGIPGLTFHGLRRSLGGILIGHFGATRDQVRALLRHGDQRTTDDFYLPVDAYLLHRTVRHLSFARPAA